MVILFGNIWTFWNFKFMYTKVDNKSDSELKS